MKSKLSSNVTRVIKMIIFFAAAINGRYKIIFRNQKFEPIWLRYICTNFMIPMSLQTCKWKSRVSTKFTFYFERKLHLIVKMF